MERTYPKSGIGNGVFDAVIDEQLDGRLILALNSGSSSLKLGLYLFAQQGTRKLVSGEAEEIGGNGGRAWVGEGSGDKKEELRNFSTITEAAQYLLSRIFNRSELAPQAIGHRIVHGGPQLRQHQRITPEVLRELENATVFAPLHLPRALDVIREAAATFPAVPQIACFDTAFHRTIPEHAARLPFSRDFWERGVHRYGFHGLSCESIVHELKSDLPPRTIIAHLGNGCSITAVRRGESLETTMGLTPTGGVIMGTRSGDLDPGVLLYLQQAEGYDATQLDSLLNHKSGLLGISELSSDMRQLLASAEQNEQARLAVKMFCYQVRKSIGAMAAVLGGGIWLSLPAASANMPRQFELKSVRD
jgi:Acetate kinase